MHAYRGVTGGRERHNFLAMINILNAVTTNSPKSASGGLTAIEIWLWTCNLFVFAALLE